MAENYSAGSSLEILDQLIDQAKALNARLAPFYPDIFADTPAQSVEEEEVDESRFFAPLAEEPDDEGEDGCSSGSDNGPVFSENDLQAYSLRHKFFGLEPISAWDTALSAQQAPEKRSAASKSSPDDEELFLYVVSKFASGVIDEAGYGIAQMEKRDGDSAMLRFLPAYTALDIGASREKINRLISRCAENQGQPDHDAAIMELVRGMLQSAMQVIRDAEDLQAAGYRNKQEALRIAANKAQQRAEHLRQIMNF